MEYKQTQSQVPRLIETLGGVTAIARMLGIEQPSVSEWKANKRIPAPRLAQLAIATGRRVRSLDVLTDGRLHIVWPEIERAA